MYNNGGTYGSDDGYTAAITSSTNLQFVCNTSGFDVYWQVVEYADCSVQQVASTLTGTSSTGTISTAVDLTKTMLFTTHSISGNVNADDLPRTELTNSTTLTHTRVGSTNTIVLNTFVVEFTDATDVTQGTQTFIAAEGSHAVAVTNAGLDSSVVWCPGNYGRQGSTAYNTTDNMGYGWFRMGLTSSSNLNIIRENTGSSADVSFQIVRFPYDQTRTPGSTPTNPAGAYDDAQFRATTRGTTTLPSGSTTLDVAISVTDLTKTIMVFSTTCDDADIRDFLVTGALTSTTNLRFQRSGNGTAVDISYDLIEFFGDVTVQHGTTTLSSTTVNETISAVELDKTFVLATVRRSGTDYGNDDGFLAELTSTTNMQLTAGGTGGVVEWQIVDYDDTFVRTVRTTIADGQTLSTPSIYPAGCSSVNGVDPNKTMIISHHTQDGSTSADDLPKVTLEDSTSLRIERNTGNNSLEYIIYVVEFLDSTEVQIIEPNFGSGETFRNETISSVDTSRSVVFGTGAFQREGLTAYTTNDNTGYNWGTFELTSPTNVLASRAVSGATATIPFQVVEFIRGEEPLPIELGSFDVQRQNDLRRVRWTTWSESNSSHFNVQISVDGKQFEKIGRVDASGFSNNLVEYSFSSTFEQKSTLEYYRLEQVDFDGKRHYSNVVVIELSDQSKVFLYPNPLDDGRLTLSGHNIGSQYRILSSDGRLLEQGILLQEFQELDLRSLTTGLYLVEWGDVNNPLREKLIVR